VAILNPVRVTPEAIDDLLPQTQCRQCGYPGCRPYAEAVATGRAGINQCAPGGDETIRGLAALLDLPFTPLDPAYGATKPPAVAVIDEALCIGCTLCIKACPVDAIAGAARLMHTVIAAECTGCELCVPPCPVNCISLVQTGRNPAGKERSALARQRYLARCGRMEREKAERTARLLAAPDSGAESRKAATIDRVMRRAREHLRDRKRDS